MLIVYEKVAEGSKFPLGAGSAAAALLFAPAEKSRRQVGGAGHRCGASRPSELCARTHGSKVLRCAKRTTSEGTRSLQVSYGQTGGCMWKGNLFADEGSLSFGGLALSCFVRTRKALLAKGH